MAPSVLEIDGVFLQGSFRVQNMRRCNTCQFESFMATCMICKTEMKGVFERAYFEARVSDAENNSDLAVFSVDSEIMEVTENHVLTFSF